MNWYASQGSRIIALLVLALALTSCAYGDLRRSTIEVRENANAHLRASIGHIKNEHLAKCRTTLERKAGILRNKQYFLAGPLKPDPKLLCFYLESKRIWYRQQSASYIYYAAPIKLVEDSERTHIPTATPWKTKKFLSCMFKVDKGAVSLEFSGFGVLGNKYIARHCGLPTG